VSTSKVEKEVTLNKSFQATSTAASKKQRQTLKGVIEGLNAATQSSLPGSSSKRKNVSEALWSQFKTLARITRSTFQVPKK